MAVVIALVRTAWSGTSGGPGVTQMAVQSITDPHTWDATSAQEAVNNVRAFWDAVKAQIPNNVTLTVSPVVDVYSIISGTLVGSHVAGTPPTAVVGTSSGQFAMANGIKLNLLTNEIRNGRRVRGAIFVVPIGFTAFNSDGTVDAATVTLFNTAAATMLGAFTTDNVQLAVWSRPQTLPVPRDGAASPVATVQTHTKGAVLRGRRD